MFLLSKCNLHGIGIHQPSKAKKAFIKFEKSASLVSYGYEYLYLDFAPQGFQAKMGLKMRNYGLQIRFSFINGPERVSKTVFITKLQF